MADERRFISPTRWAVFEVQPQDSDDDRTHVWLRKTAAEDLNDWADRKLGQLREIAAKHHGLTLLRFRADLSSKYGPRVTPESVSDLRATVVQWLTANDYVVVPDQPNEVYAIELESAAADGRTQLYVGVTSDLPRRLAEHRGDIQDGTPPGKAVKKHGFKTYRGDLVEDFPQVPAAAKLELEAQVSALLRHRGYEVHGDGVRRRPSNTRFVSGVSWAELIAAYEDANG